jgi:hypothetical protein
MVQASRVFWPWLMATALVACGHLGSAGGSGRYYSWVDAEGKMHSQRLPDSPGAVPAPAAAVPGPAVAVPVVPAAEAPAPAQQADVFAPDDSFVDSDVLEQNHFDMSKKKKFGMVTDASGRSFPVYYERGEGLGLPDRLAAPPVEPVNMAAALAAEQWPLPAGLLDSCCTALLQKDHTELGLTAGRSYDLRMPLGCGSVAACHPVVLELPKRKGDYTLRLYSYLESRRCKVCLQWPAVVVLDRKQRPLRAYAAELGGFMPESWHGYASFHFDFNISANDDAYLMLLQSERPLSYQSKHYTASDKGEIAFALIP